MTKIRVAISRRLTRKWKRAVQSWRIDQSVPKKAVYIFGCQGSGTTMLLSLLGKSASVFEYGEMDPPVMKRDLRIVSHDQLKTAIQSTPSYVVLMKPICDSQWACRLLDVHSPSAGLWMYRHFEDNVNSIHRRFTGHLDRCRKMAAGDLKFAGWRSEAMSQRDVDLLRTHLSDDATDQDAIALMWYLRNRLYLDQELHRDNRVRLVRYENLVERTPDCVERICGFVGLPPESLPAEMIHSQSLGRREPPELAPAIFSLCDGLMQELDARLVSQWKS